MTTGLISIDETYYYGHTPSNNGCEAYLFRKEGDNVYSLVMSGYYTSLNDAELRFKEYTNRISYPNC